MPSSQDDLSALHWIKLKHIKFNSIDYLIIAPLGEESGKGVGGVGEAARPPTRVLSQEKTPPEGGASPVPLCRHLHFANIRSDISELVVNVLTACLNLVL